MKKEKPEALVSVLKDERDLDLLLKEKWYRVPLKHAPSVRPSFFAFYQPASFGKSGRRIELFGKVKRWRIRKRRELLPEEKKHPRADEPYIQFFLGNIRKLKRPVLNRGRMRISFGFTTLARLRKSRDIRGLFAIPPMEETLSAFLRKNHIPFKPQFTVRRRNNKIFRLDFALFCSKGKLDAECDGFRWHSRKRQKNLDSLRDRELRSLGWKILRVSEEELVENPAPAFRKVMGRIKALGGPRAPGLLLNH